MSMRPTRKHRLLFWLLLSCLSVAFAEVFAGSSLFPFLTPWGIVVLIPLYGLHLLMLATVVFRFGRPRFSTLYPAGMLFVMYEAYITKVLWDPTWGDAVLTLGGVAVVESVLLVLFWHAVLAFIVPLMVGERLATGTNSVLRGMPSIVQRLLSSKRIVLAGFALAGLFQGINSPTVLHSLGSGLSSGAVVLVLLYVWRRSTRSFVYSLEDLLPDGRDLRVLAPLLAVLYFLFGVEMRPEVLPGLGPQAVIWLAYLLTGALLYRGLRRSRAAMAGSQRTSSLPSWRLLVGAPVIFAMASAISVGVLFQAVPAAYILFWLTLSGLGMLLLALAIHDAFAAKRSTRVAEL